MSPSVATRTWGSDSTTDTANRRPLAILVVVGVVLAVLIAPRLALPAKVPPLTITNANEYTVMVEASNGRGDGWAPVAIIRSGQTAVVHELIDQGPDWTFRFTGQGRQFTGYGVSRAQLAADGWHYTVPDDVAAQLRADRVPASP